MYAFGYFIFGVIIFVIIGLSYKPKYGIEFSHYATLMTLVRFAIRIADFEGTKAILSRATWEALNYTLFAGIWWTFGMLSVMLSKRKRSIKILFPLSMIATIVCCYVGIVKGEDFEFSQPFAMGIPIFAGIIYLSTFKAGRHIPDMILLIFQKD